MRKTLLLVFIHGFKGGDDTFGSFPEHLRALVSHALPDIDVATVTYPRFETRGELKDCVARFREWLENKVIDIEVAHSTPSPTIDPSVHVVLVGHSMGGIVAAETFLLLSAEQPLPAAASAMNPMAPNFPSNTTLASSTSQARPQPDASKPDTTGFMFPHVQGILAFDTPFLGLAPGMVAHQLEGGGKMATNAYNTYTEVANIFGWGSKSEPDLTRPATSARALPAPAVSSAADAAAAPKWQSWGKYAMFAGAAGAVAAGGAAALYSQREKISAGWGWATSHLLFVGDLARVENLKKRVEMVEKTSQERGSGCANLYTQLGKGAREGYGVTSTVKGPERTFANLPAKAKDGDKVKESAGKGMHWWPAVNEKATDETKAHMSMFTPKDNPGFYALGQKAKEMIGQWVDQSWYNTSDKKPAQEENIKELSEDWEKPDVEEVKDTNGIGKDWEGLDGAKDPDDDVQMRDEDKENLELEDSVIVDKASNGEIPLPVETRGM